MSTLVFCTPRSLRGALGAALLAVVASTAIVTSPARAEGQQVSAAVFEKYDPARQAYQKHDFATALKLGKEALAVAKSSFEKQACLKMIMGAAVSSRNYPEAIEALEQLINTEGVPAAEKLGYHKTLGQLYGATNRIDKAIAETKEYIKGSGGAPADWDALSKLYFGAKDCNSSLQALEKALPGGKQADEDQLKLQARCYFQMKQDDKLLAVSEEALRRFPKRDYYTQVLRSYQEKKVDDMALLALLRFGYDRDYLEAEGDYVKLADLALDVGTTAEAQRVLEKGIAKKQVKNADKAARLLAQAKDRAAEDKKTLSQLDAEARAGKNGESDVKVGYHYFSQGEFDKAAEAISRGLSPERLARVKRPDDANMVLGIAYLKLKKKADAEKAFTAAKADPRMAAVAKVWLNAT